MTELILVRTNEKNKPILSRIRASILTHGAHENRARIASSAAD